MAVERITREGAANRALRDLDVNHFGLDDVEAQAAILRHAASHRCPVTPRALIDDVLASVEWLLEDSGEIRERFVETLGLLIGCGDVIEGRVDDEVGGRRMLFLGPPTFVPASGRTFVIGVRPDGLPLLGERFSTDMLCKGPLRVLPFRADEDLADELVDEGLRPLSLDAWIAAPRRESADQFVGRFVDRLSLASEGSLEGVRVIDPSRPVTHYKGRWRELLPADRGHFVGRREQAYGSDLWCVFDVTGEFSGRLIDLPAVDVELPGADEAWRLQAAIDARRGSPQVLRVAHAEHEADRDLVLFSPVPGWAQRRLDAVGAPTTPSDGGLFAYAVPVDAESGETVFLAETMWIQAEGK